MARPSRQTKRRGAILVLLLVCLVALMACVALAIDLGMIMAARTQVVDAADGAAMAGARALNGNTTNNANNNYSAALPAAQQAATGNTILAGAISNSDVMVNIGRYVYNSSGQRFEGQFPGPSAENWSLVQATVKVPLANRLAFSRVLNFSPGNLQATATAVHRPRDVAIILDFSGSMRFQSLSGGMWGGSDLHCNNPDNVVPRFGHYGSIGAGQLWATSFDSPFDAANVTTTTNDGRPPIVNDFYQDNTGTPAWVAAQSSYGTTPGGDDSLKTNKNTGSYAQTAAQVLNISSPGNSTRDATFETTGYLAYGMVGQFNGYTLGPGYWGKTFFNWPPNPIWDWRKLYFTYPGTVIPMDDNSRLWDSNGNWRAPDHNTYAINYTAILAFIKSMGPNVFPNRLQSGRIVYYTSIPSTIDTSSSPPTDLNQRFWKDYIDYCLGVVDRGGGDYKVISDGNTGYTGYGCDFPWGNVKITPKSSLQQSGGSYPYMHYGDNPLRPITKFWFGPQSMVDFLGNFTVGYNVADDGRNFWWPGTCHEAPMYACKLGIRSALTDIQNNHPNDLVSLIMFSTPKTGVNDTGSRFNRVRVGLSRNYSDIQDALWYPPATVGNPNATVTPYDANNVEVPRAFGSTCYSYPLMLAYNQFSGNTSLQTYSSGQQTGDSGGMGRKGAQKTIIFETDGAPNTMASAGFTSLGSYNSYYNIRYNYANPGGSEYPTNVNNRGDLDSSVTNQILTICNQICAPDTAGVPGYSSGSKKVKLHCIGFGPYFSPGSSQATAATSFLNQMQLAGNVSDGMPDYKVIYGSQSDVITKLQKAFQKIMQDGIQVTLIQ
jgi:Flp pilus assembly protein TadG